MQRATETANAKVNLLLFVEGRRDDGFHSLFTIFDELSLCDDLSFAPGVRGNDGSPLSLELSFETEPKGLSVPDDVDNLVLAAARSFGEVAGQQIEGRFFLHKRIPAGAGLGGGSSDAAAALRLLARQYGVDAQSDELGRLAGTLGADVPFFLHGGRAWADGRGDQIHPFRTGEPLHYVLVFPGYPCATGQVFAEWAKDALNRRGHDSRCALTYRETRLDSLSSSDGCALPGGPGLEIGYAHLRSLYNELEEAALATEPRLGLLRERLVSMQAGAVHLSGSGSTLFFATSDEDHATCLYRRLRDELPDWQREGFLGVTTGASLFRTMSVRESG